MKYLYYMLVGLIHTPGVEIPGVKIEVDIYIYKRYVYTCRLRYRLLESLYVCGCVFARTGRWREKERNPPVRCCSFDLQRGRLE